MKKFLILTLLFPLIALAQQPKPAAKPKPKAATTTATKPKPATGAVKPKTTATTPKKPGTPAPKKVNPAVVKLVDKAYEHYKNNKDKECEATIKQILALDPKNKDAYMLRANIAMYNNKMDDVWKYLNLIYKYNPSEPDIYSQFAVNHLTYIFLSDSFKRVFCRKTILLASNRAEGYASLGLVAAVGGNYDEAITYFNISFNKPWRDTTSKTILQLPYARCLYEVGEKEEAINTISTLMTKIKGDDRYTCMFMRATYKLETGKTDVKEDVDSLLSRYPNDIGVKQLQLKYLKKSGDTSSSLCAIAKEIRSQTENNSFDISEYCNDLKKTIAINNTTTLTYDIKGITFTVQPAVFDYNNTGIVFNWSRAAEGRLTELGVVNVTKAAIDTATLQKNYFRNATNDTLNNAIAIWMSKKQLAQISKDSTVMIGTNGYTANKFKYSGHDQIEILNNKNIVELVDCIRLTDGEEAIWYLNDPSNPLIVKMDLQTFSIILSKFE